METAQNEPKLPWISDDGVGSQNPPK
jgi:hypothetical protein